MDHLINEFGIITRWPKKPLDKEVVIKYLAEKIKSKISYTEKEINKIISIHHLFNDVALLRRELVSRNVLRREDDGSKYWKIL